MPLSIAIVDDDSSYRERLRSYCTQYQKDHNSNCIITEYSSGDDFLNASNSFDVLFLDIEMEGINGLDTAREIRRTNQDLIIIFVTNLAQYALDGYEVNAADYLLKPITYPDFNLKFSKALRFLNIHKRTTLMLSSVEGMQSIDV